jgi:hypothetical protein
MNKLFTGTAIAFLIIFPAQEGKPAELKDSANGVRFWH